MLDIHFIELMNFFRSSNTPFYNARLNEIQDSILGELGYSPNYDRENSFTLLSNTSEVFAVQKCITELGFHLERHPDRDSGNVLAYSIVPNWK